MAADRGGYSTRPLSPDTWEASGALEAIRAAGGLVEAYPEQVVDRPPQRGAYFHTGPETLFEEFGSGRDRQIARWRWVMRLTVDV